MNLSLKDSINKIKSHARGSEKISAIKTPGKRLNSEHVNTYRSNVRRQPNSKDSGRFDQILKRIYTNS